MHIAQLCIAIIMAQYLDCNCLDSLVTLVDDSPRLNVIPTWDLDHK